MDFLSSTACGDSLDSKANATSLARLYAVTSNGLLWLSYGSMTSSSEEITRPFLMVNVRYHIALMSLN